MQQPVWCGVWEPPEKNGFPDLLTYLACTPYYGGCCPKRKEERMPIVTTVPELAAQMHKDPSKLYEWAKRAKDPLPLRYIDGERYGSVLVSEFDEWYRRNGLLWNEKALKYGAGKGDEGVGDGY